MAAWLAAAMLLVLRVPPKDPRKTPEPQLLPPDTPCCRGERTLARYFPNRSGMSEAAIVFERSDGPLTPADRDAIEHIASRLTTPTGEADAADLAGVSVRSPASLEAPVIPLTGEPMWPNLFISPPGRHGQAAMVLVNIPTHFISLRTDRIVRHIRSVVAARPLPVGLAAAVSGSAGFGHDYAVAARISHRRTVQVTLVAVVVILLAVYRTPVAPLVPLGAISLAAVVATKGLTLAAHLGLNVGTAEEIFVFVLLYGAGVDYTMLLVSRYREMLGEGVPADRAAAGALTVSFPAILASACTVTLGLAMMSFARYGVFRTAGPAVALAIAVALLASVTLAPALVGIGGARLFWPARVGGASAAGLLPLRTPRLWALVARAVTARPILVGTITVAAFAAPAIQGLNARWVYDTLASIRAYEEAGLGGAAKGLTMAQRHWSVGEVAPATVLIQADRPVPGPQWDAATARISQDILAVPHVSGVRSLAAPLGASAPPAANFLAKTVGATIAGPEYLSADGTTTRLSVVLDRPALTLEAMEALAAVRRSVQQALQKLDLRASVLVAGATAEMADVRDLTRRNFRLITVLALAAIFLIVLALLRDPWLSAFMVGSTLLSYLATLGISYWARTGLWGEAGLDWKVEVFLFVVMVAVGQDYNIFLAARLAQEAPGATAREATRRAVVHTGPVISSCGLIMAATLGSLMGARLLLLQQLGFALALGMLIDTFIVRPLLLPAFVATTGRTGKGHLAHGPIAGAGT
ncbi:MAG: MMPL family transporter [Phycisphaerae bacterium]|nr:MMPL family transporter [Phycisphaerae bacterium]